MAEQRTESTEAVSDAGIAGNHGFLKEPQALVGPATGSEHNTLKAAIIPIACWRVEDVRFEFDSSVVRPEMKTELKHLADLVRKHPSPSKTGAKPGHPLSVFGHADPTGNDDYNKQLSGRRATAIYALLTRRTDLWENLFSRPFGNDKWGKGALEMMLDFVAQPEGEEAENGRPQSRTSQDAVLQHERDAGKRKTLFAAYMDKLAGSELKLERGDFLARGADPGGKGDFQGCSEFNPVMIFSEDEQQKFEQAKDKTQRDAANTPNRRVMVLIFRKGSRVRAARWPCPRALEGVAGCKKRFWSDGEKRRGARLPKKRREFKDNKDTFACRFYHRLLNDSPCEKVIATVRVRLFDLRGSAMPKVGFFAELNGRQERGKADANGEFALRDVELPSTCLVRWSRRSVPTLPIQKLDSPDLPPDLLGESEKAVQPADQPVDQDRDFEFETVLNLDVPDASDNSGSDDEAIVRRLHNLGYPKTLASAVRIELFNRDTGATERAPASGGGVEKEVVRRHDGLTPPRKS